MEPKMQKGNVKEYNLKRGYGIIVDSATGQSLTVYANYICLQNKENLKEGQEVEFEIESNRPQNWAVNVRIL